MEQLYGVIDLVERARCWAVAGHNAIGQKRKYVNDAYWVHPLQVASMLNMSGASKTLIAAAWLHDLVEDTEITIDQIREEFGNEVANLVGEVTDVSEKNGMTRPMRKTLDWLHLKKASIEGKQLKMVDCIANLLDLPSNDPKFATMYVVEVSLLLADLREGSDKLYFELKYQLSQACDKLRLDKERIAELSIPYLEAKLAVEQGAPRTTWVTNPLLELQSLLYLVEHSAANSVVKDDSYQVVIEVVRLNEDNEIVVIPENTAIVLRELYDTYGDVGVQMWGEIYSGIDSPIFANNPKRLEIYNKIKATGLLPAKPRPAPAASFNQRYTIELLLWLEAREILVVDELGDMGESPYVLHLKPSDRNVAVVFFADHVARAEPAVYLPAFKQGGYRKVVETYCAVNQRKFPPFFNYAEWLQK